MINKKKNQVDEKDFIKLIIIVGVLVVAYFVWMNVAPIVINQPPKANIITITADDCVDCLTIPDASSSLSQIGAEVRNEETVDYSSDEGKKLIEKYDIEKVPALIVVSKKIDQLSLGEAFRIKDNYAVFNLNVPYKDLNSGDIKGLVNLIEIIPNCEDCASLSNIQGQFEQMGIKVGENKKILENSAEGQELISNYNLDFAPVLLVSKDIEEYALVSEQILAAFEDKGDYYLFKQPIAPYVDLETREIKGRVSIIMINDSSCEDCFDVSLLKDSFASSGVYFIDESYVDASAKEGGKLLERYNVTKVPTVILSKEILDYPQLRDALASVGDFDKTDQSFVFRDLDALGQKYKKLEGGSNGNR